MYASGLTLFHTMPFLKIKSVCEAKLKIQNHENILIQNLEYFPFKFPSLFPASGSVTIIDIRNPSTYFYGWLRKADLSLAGTNK